MAVFILLACLLAVACLVAVLRPLFAAHRPLAAGLALLCLAASGALYVALGTPDALDPALVKPPQTLAQARYQLERRLASAPDQGEAWYLLGRAYMAEGKAAQAAEALAKAAAHLPTNADVLTEAAEARALQTGTRQIDAQGVAWLDAALKAEPQHQRARWFRGIAYRQNGQPKEAAALWEGLLAQVDGAAATALLPEINAARAAAGLPALAPPAASEAAQETALRIRVRLAPALRETLRAYPDAQVFVLARAADGPPMPVAVVRHRPDALPEEILLTDADSPMPTAKLSALREVEVLARLSLGGSANRAEGDVESRVHTLRLPHAQVIELALE